jgi:hypothetical protein
MYSGVYVGTDPLIIDDGNLLNAAKSTEFFIQITFLSTDAEPKHSEYVGRIGCLLGLVNNSLQMSKNMQTDNWSMGRPTRSWRPTSVRRTTVSTAARGRAARARTAASRRRVAVAILSRRRGRRSSIRITVGVNGPRSCRFVLKGNCCKTTYQFQRRQLFLPFW